MQQYSNHECVVFLSGILSEMPQITADWSTNGVIVVTRKYHTDNLEFKKESYRVMLNQFDMARIIQSGYINMPIEIHGELRVTNEAEIIADTVRFVDAPNSNQPESVFFQQKLMQAAVRYH